MYLCLFRFLGLIGSVDYGGKKSPPLEPKVPYGQNNTTHLVVGVFLHEPTFKNSGSI